MFCLLQFLYSNQVLYSIDVNRNMNGHGNSYDNSNGHPHPPANQANNRQQNPRHNLDGVNRVAAFRQCNPPTYDGNELRLVA